ncbi:hypothetical protein FACS189487_05900 [Campylobacterota bacterium]|nr:hypothetical protein FACS189487_05900 [Campylobacterota bacterium]
MEILTFLGAIKHKNSRRRPRKTAFFGDRTLIYGAPGVGKSSLLIDAAENYDNGAEFLYIDLDDDRVSADAVNSELESYIAANKIKILAIDNYDEAVKLPRAIEAIYLTAKKKTEIAGFDSRELFAPDFEEFLSFTARNDPRSAFDEFLRGGAIFDLRHLDETERVKRSQNMLKLLCNTPQKMAILTFFLRRLAAPLTPHQAYESLKPNIAISKDTLYSYINELLAARMLFAIEKFDTPNAPKKFYPFDHILREAVSFDRAFLKTFENMIALELIKKEREIYYADGIDLYLADERRAVIAAPFADREAIYERMARFAKNTQFEKAEFITMGFSETALDRAEAVPFWEWALRQ